ncbi:early nodulin-like protein 7 [Malania oleifera]|uniref:early nodulin-like protein 7 n=1 Tax=Malania oleifera TaxID=397392 RepID=UPI0025ADD37F|nr:early nodulin-like protein 7 [Malania oleifera]
MRKNTSMGSVLALLCTSLMIVAAINARVCAAKDFKVGDADGWREPTAENEAAMYSLWASRNRFQVGDSLRFEYSNDSVLVVDKWAYYHCNTSKPIAAYSNGNSLIKLDKPGPIYFVSGTANHCKNGQRLLVDVMEPRPISQSPPSTAPPTEPYFSASPAPSPLSNSGAIVSETMVPVSMALIAALGALVL